jgi:hypothetical protein
VSALGFLFLEGMNIPVQLRPVEFRIVAENSSSQCEKQVNELLAQDWVMHGDLKVTHNEALQTSTYVQAMAKVELRPPPGMSGMGSSIAVPQPGSIPIIGR